jgi:hypothetical protein
MKITLGRTRSAVIAFTLLAVLLAACTSNQIITSITLVVDAAEVALPIITNAAGVSPTLITQLESYLAAVGQALATTTDILAKNEPPAQQYADITAAFANVALPVLPAGLPAAIVSAVSKVAALVSKFLAGLPRAPQTIAIAGKTTSPVVFSAKDQVKLKLLHDRAAKLASIKR